ncbi:MAG: hypothetical protein NZ956_02635 [Candidatus Caldarchaeum sp.]|nr:hypothetical protein [Candidatus Caldarchaeum sp.]
MSQQAAGPRMVLSDPYQKKASTIQLTPQQFGLLKGKKIGESVDGSAFGYKGFVVKITGGTDKDGFPMRPDVSGPRKVQILLSGGVGFHPRRKPPSKRKKRRKKRLVKGMRKRVTVRGNMIGEAVAQVNAVLVKKEG